MAEPVEKLVSGGELAEQPRLSAEEGWKAFDELVGSMTGWFDEYGGADEWLRKHRSGED